MTSDEESDDTSYSGTSPTAVDQELKASRRRRHRKRWKSQRQLEIPPRLPSRSPSLRSLPIRAKRRPSTRRPKDKGVVYLKRTDTQRPAAMLLESLRRSMDSSEEETNVELEGAAASLGTLLEKLKVYPEMTKKEEDDDDDSYSTDSGSLCSMSSLSSVSSVSSEEESSTPGSSGMNRAKSLRSLFAPALSKFSAFQRMDDSSVSDLDDDVSFVQSVCSIK